tara:strand:+ start:1112 stop:1489 length:378 start_codon:yes stop_codon:yes gene_type:complete
VTEVISAGYASAEGKINEKASAEQIVRNESAEKTAKRNDLLKNISNIKIEDRLSNSKSILLQIRDYWWEDDIEDWWPWLEIVLAVIAILIIAILVIIFASVVGGLISSLLGLILLIALAYILYTL